MSLVIGKEISQGGLSMAYRSYYRPWRKRDVREGEEPAPGKKRQLRATPGRDRTESQRLDWRSMFTHQHMRADLRDVETPPSALRPAHAMVWIKAGRGGRGALPHTTYVHTANFSGQGFDSKELASLSHHT